MKQRKIEFNARTQYGENPSAKLYKRMQYSHEQYRQLAREHSDEPIDRNIMDHNKMAFPRKFHKEQ
jgi:hypothetical protein